MGLGKIVEGFISFEDCLGVTKIGFGFPCIFGCGVVFPFDEIFASCSVPTVGTNCFDFELFFSFDKVRWWSAMGWAICFGLGVSHEKRSVENGMYTPFSS